MPVLYGIVSANQDPDDGPVSFLGPRAGVILGYEQPVQARISIVADWYSGKNGFGYFTPGISITLPGSGLLNAGYSIGNDSWEDDNATRNRYFFVYYGVTFNLVSLTIVMIDERYVISIVNRFSVIFLQAAHDERFVFMDLMPRTAAPAPDRVVMHGTLCARATRPISYSCVRDTLPHGVLTISWIFP